MLAVMIRRRPTARVLLLDADDRILLMQGRDVHDPSRAPFWFTVGGGIDEGETVLDAARREIIEETGLRPTTVGPVLWRSEAEIRGFDGGPILMQEHFVLARCVAAPLSRAGWTEVERSFALDLRWWTLEDIAASAEIIYPVDLAERLAALVADGGPAL
jgi:8-oxo-dGTP pyrophosphatase MutT (NUDIX family)